MDAKMKKRLEKAADKYANRQVNVGTQYHCRTEGFFYGAEYGYKEAIAQCKEWMIKHTVTRMPEEDDKDFVWVESDRYEDKDEFIARFENDMKELWED